MKTITVLLVLLLFAFVALSAAGCGRANPLRIASVSRSSSQGSGPVVPYQPALPQAAAPTWPAPGSTIPPAPEDKAHPTTTALPAAAGSEPGDGAYADWSGYANTHYDFALRYPDNWTLIQEPSDGRLSPMVKLSRGAYTLVIGFKSADEDLIIEAGMPAGDLAYRGKITMLGVTVTREVLTYDGKDKAVYYNGTASVEAGDLRMLVSLQSLTTGDYDAVSIPEDVQSEADLIVESIEMR